MASMATRSSTSSSISQEASMVLMHPPPRSPRELVSDALSVKADCECAAPDSAPDWRSSRPVRLRSESGEEDGSTGAELEMRLGFGLVRSATVLARTLVACEEKRERRHREVLELEERRLRLEEERMEVRRQGFAGLVSAVDILSSAFYALVSDHHSSDSLAPTPALRDIRRQPSVPTERMHREFSASTNYLAGSEQLPVPSATKRKTGISVPGIPTCSPGDIGTGCRRQPDGVWWRWPWNHELQFGQCCWGPPLCYQSWGPTTWSTTPTWRACRGA